MQVQRRVSAEEALGGFVRLARSSRLTADEHDQFALWAAVLKTESDEGAQAKQELEALKAEHAKCAQQPSPANPNGGQVASQGNGSDVGKDGGSVEPSLPVQELIQ